MNYKHLEYKVDDRIAWIIFNRPDQLNAMNSVMMTEIINALESVRAANTDEVRVGVITGNGKAFMAGADIKEYATQRNVDILKNSRLTSRAGSDNFTESAQCRFGVGGSPELTRRGSLDRSGLLH